MSSTVCIIDDEESVQEALSWLLSSVGLQVKSYLSAQAFLDDLDVESSIVINAGCVLLDVRMPVMSGIELQQVLIEKKIDLPIIFLTAHGDVPMAVNALKSGAFDFIQKPFNNQQLIDAVMKSIRESEVRLKKVIKLSDIQSKLSVLTARERDVYLLMVKGLSNKGMSRELSVSSKTIETHRANLNKKLNVKYLSELIEIEGGESLEPESQ